MEYIPTANLTALTVSGLDPDATDVKVDISLYTPEGTELILTEHYTPETPGVVVIRDLAPVLDACFSFPVPSIQDPAPTRILRKGFLTAYDGKHFNPQEFNVVYSTVRVSVVGDGGTGFPMDRFLSRYIEKGTYPDSIEPVSFIPLAGRSYALEVAYLDQNGTDHFTAIPLPLALPTSEAESVDTAHTHWIDMAALAADLSASRLLYVDASIREDGDTGGLLDRIRFSVVPAELTPLHRRTVVYRNPFGLPETFCFRGTVTETFDPRSEFGHTVDAFLKLSDDPVLTEESRTGALRSDEERESAQDLLRAFDIYELEDGKIGSRLVITDWEAEREYPSTAIAGYTMTLRREQLRHGAYEANRRAAVVSRKRVFDDSFDRSFE